MNIKNVLLNLIVVGIVLFSCSDVLAGRDFSSYYSDNNIMYYDGEIIEEFDLDSREDFGYDLSRDMFIKDKNHVYYKGKKIEGSDSESFEFLDLEKMYYGNYAKDKNNVYLEYCVGGMQPVEECEVDIIVGADPETFSVVVNNDGEASNFSKDKNNVYFLGDLVEEANPKSFELINYHYSKDKNNVYGNYGKKLLNSDPETFKILNNVYSKDKNNIYGAGKVLLNSDPKSFIILDEEYWEVDVAMGSVRGMFAKDNNQMYFNGNIIKNSDPKSFEKLSNSYYKDKNNVYYAIFPHPENGIESIDIVEGVDSETFSVLSWRYSKDKNNIYEYGKIIDDEESLERFDELWGEKSEADEGYYVENGKMFYNSNLVEDFNIDSVEYFRNSLEKIVPNFVKDKNHVYLEGRIVRDADVDSFEFLDNDGFSAKDKNNMYSMSCGGGTSEAKPVTCYMEVVEEEEIDKDDKENDYYESQHADNKQEEKSIFTKIWNYITNILNKIFNK
jgi:hypothetical protein